MDDIDKQILEILQADTTISTADIADRVGLSTTPCWRRIQLLEQAGYITKRVALIDRSMVNVPLDVFVAIKTNQHAKSWLHHFNSVVSKLPEVVELYRMSGDVDYLMRVVVPDMAAYDKFYRALIEKIDLSDVSSSFAMERIKYTTALPLSYANGNSRHRRRKSDMKITED